MQENNLVFHPGHLSRKHRNLLNGHASGLVWLTGLSASGKSTIAHCAEKALHNRGIRSFVLDGDNIRHGLNADLGFTRDHRKENLRRVAELAKLFVDAGIIVIAAFVSPYREDRLYIRRRFENDIFAEVYIKCSLNECEKRDPKGQYRKARSGIIGNYTGISAPYEEPEDPDLIIDTEEQDLEGSIDSLFALMENMGLLTA